MFTTAEGGCLLTAALPNVQRMFYTVNTVLLVKTVLGEVYSLMSTVPITKIEICLNFCTSLPRMKTSISASFFCIKSSTVILQARLDSYPTYSFFNINFITYTNTQQSLSIFVLRYGLFLAVLFILSSLCMKQYFL